MYSSYHTFHSQETGHYIENNIRELLMQNTPFLLKRGVREGLPPEVQKVVNPVILDDRKYIQNQGLAENISKT